MFGGIDPKKMQSLMKQMGISQKEIKANKVIIETDEKNIIIENPSVIQVNMQGNTNFQISGEVTEEDNSKNTKEQDIQTIIDKTKCSRQEAEEALGKTQDLTEAILSLS
jgi:nascent polypeptide-associated complex subunit alpha